jgi:hypothetical protein
MDPCHPDTFQGVPQSSAVILESFQTCLQVLPTSSCLEVQWRDEDRVLAANLSHHHLPHHIPQA